MSTSQDVWTPHPNGAEQAEVRVRFGDLPTQTMPLEWAELMLRIVYIEYPGMFRAILPRLYGLPDAAPKRTRNRPGGQQ